MFVLQLDIMYNSVFLKGLYSCFWSTKGLYSVYSKFSAFLIHCGRWTKLFTMWPFFFRAKQNITCCTNISALKLLKHSKYTLALLIPHCCKIYCTKKRYSKKKKNIYHVGFALNIVVVHFFFGSPVYEWFSLFSTTGSFFIFIW